MFMGVGLTMFFHIIFAIGSANKLSEHSFRENKFSYKKFNVYYCTWNLTRGSDICFLQQKNSIHKLFQYLIVLKKLSENKKNLCIHIIK
jgi:hypothetical protein